MKDPMRDPEEIPWLLGKIRACREDMRPQLRKRSSKRDIFRGGYDVWEDKSDGLKYDKIMDDRLNEARDLGLIVTESGVTDWKYSDNWILTESGEKRLEEHSQ